MKGFFYQQSHTKSHMKTPSAHIQEEWMMAEKRWMHGLSE